MLDISNNDKRAYNYPMSREFPSLHAAPQASAGFLLWQATNRWQRRQRMALKPLGLTPVQVVLLATLDRLAEEEGAVSQARLAAAAGADVMMTSQVVRALARRGWVVREADPADRRTLRLKLTPAGLALTSRALTASERVDEEFFAAAGIPAERFATFCTRLLSDE